MPRRFPHDGFPDMDAGDRREVIDGDHAFLVTALDQTAIHSGRRRFLVECVTCGETVHEATTGPLSNIGRHVRERAEADRQ